MKLNGQDKLGACSFWYHSALNEQAGLLLDEIKRISTQSPFRKMQTRRGTMSVEMTNCGEIGWLSDTRGYRYTKIDPLTKKPWPPMEAWGRSLAIGFARTAGFSEFRPNVCLINKYVPGARLGMHRDNNEGDPYSPIVAFSLGLPAIFRWGGLSPKAPTRDLLVDHGDVLVWGGEDRLRYHGIQKVYEADLHQPHMYERLVMTFRYSRLWQNT